MLEAGIVGLWLGQVECQVQQFQGPEEIQGGSGRGRGPFGSNKQGKMRLQGL